MKKANYLNKNISSLMKFAAAILLLTSGIGANGQGIVFATASNSWNALKQRATTEKKYIFVDCYATWCGPCKNMDENVYTDSALGKFMNDHFISVKVQMDRTKNDSKDIQDWYSDAKLIETSFDVKEYPSFLFFDSQGNLVYREVGFKSSNEFVKVAKAALDPESSLVYLKRKYDENKMLPQELSGYALLLIKNRQAGRALEIAKKYKEKVLDKLPYDSAVNMNNLLFLTTFPGVLETSDIFFKYMYTQPDAFATSMGRDKEFAASFTDYVIGKEYIRPVLSVYEKEDIVNPNWSKIEKDIRKKFSQQIARRLVINYAFDWYVKKEDWYNANKYLIKRVDLMGIDSAKGINMLLLNNSVFNLMCKHGNDQRQLRRGLEWMRQLVTIRPDNYSRIDTYACLLYKTGDKDGAVRYFNEALNLAEKKQDERNTNTFKERLKRVQNNQPLF